MNFCLLFVLFIYFSGWTSAVLYRRDTDNDLLKPDLLAVSSTVLPLPYYSLYGYEKQLLRDKNKKRPHGKISLVTSPPK